MNFSRIFTADGIYSKAIELGMGAIASHLFKFASYLSHYPSGLPPIAYTRHFHTLINLHLTLLLSIDYFFTIKP